MNGKSRTLLLVALVLVAGAIAWGLKTPTAQTEPAERTAPSQSSVGTASAVSRSPAPLGVESAKPIPASAPIPATVGDQIRALSRSNDPVDKFHAYQLAYRCQIAHEAQERFNQTVQALQQPTHPQLDQYKGACDGVTSQDLAKRRENLLAAVAAHIPAAAHQFLAEGFNGDPQALVQRPDDPLVLDWKRQVVSELQAAAQAGDRLAATDLSQMYRNNSGFVANDPVQSLTYALAEYAMDARDGHPMDEKFIEKVKARYTPDQVAAATSASTPLIQACCGK
jgi:hypothetical protein